MLYTNKKIIESLVEPIFTNVLWLHTKQGQSPILKQFEGGIWKEIDQNVLRITSNNLTDDQKEQFRENIQAANQAEVNFLTQLTEDLLATDSGELIVTEDYDFIIAI